MDEAGEALLAGPRQAGEEIFGASRKGPSRGGIVRIDSAGVAAVGVLEVSHAERGVLALGDLAGGRVEVSGEG